jgi:hypothetical protein
MYLHVLSGRLGSNLPADFQQKKVLLSGTSFRIKINYSETIKPAPVAKCQLRIVNLMAQRGAFLPTYTIC